MYNWFSSFVVIVSLSFLFSNRLRNATISFLICVCPSVRTKQLRCQRTVFNDTFILSAKFPCNISFRIQIHQFTVVNFRCTACKVLTFVADKNFSKRFQTKILFISFLREPSCLMVTDGHMCMKKPTADLSNSANWLKNY